MKANEAPEKIYIRRIWGSLAASQMNITGRDAEYTRTDAFIEKTCEWLEENVEKHISSDGEYTVDYEEMFEDFKNYMEE